MKEQAKLPLMIVACIALVGVLYFFGSKAMSVGDLDQGQVKYTPGVPPWKDPLKKNVAPSVGGQVASSPGVNNGG